MNHKCTTCKTETHIPTRICAACDEMSENDLRLLIAKKDERIKELERVLAEIESGALRSKNTLANCIGCCGGVDIDPSSFCMACDHYFYPLDQFNKKPYPLWDVDTTLSRIQSIKQKRENI